ncbi:PspC domain-containing protein [Microbacterium sp. BWT-B31]|uniref:PspC domain-containing protein n=1 Tax=Microbacterium sp. BWT-B31 TaxID=3232072 RepID=UPI003527C43A
MTEPSAPPAPADAAPEASPAADPGPPPPAPAGMPAPENRFFSWVRDLGIPRTHGWIGGVCSGLALRMGIDPIIVRGIFVVAAIVGLPALLVYAVAWALLPDTQGRILLQQLFRGRFEPAMVAVLIIAAISVFPIVPWLMSIVFWPFAAVFDRAWEFWSFGGSPVFGTALTVLLVGALVALGIWLAVRAAKDPRGGTVPGSRTASANPAAPGSLVGGEQVARPAVAPDLDPAPAPDLIEAPGPEPVGEPGPEPVAAPTATGDEIAQWRAKHDEWLAQRDAWRRSQQDAEQAAREQARVERDAAARAFAAEAAERRRVRRATKPRTSFVFVVATLGAALVAAATSSLFALGDTDTADFAGAIGVLVAAMVVSLAMVVAGVARRRSGFLAAVAIVLVGSGVIAALSAGPGNLVIGSTNTGTASWDREYIQPFGTTTIALGRLSDTEHVTAGDITVRKGVGATFIEVTPGTALSLTADLEAGGVTYTRVRESNGEISDDGVVRATDRPGGGARFQWSTRNSDPRSTGLTSQSVHLTQTNGSVYITVYVR